MSATEGISGGFRIDPNVPMLRLADLMKEAESLPLEEFDLGDGMKVQRRGNAIEFIGGERLSPQAFVAALQASEMGGEVARSMFEATLYGGDGNDSLSAYGNSTLYGGDGDDRLSAGMNSAFYGGDGDDHIAGADDATVADTRGDNYVDVYANATVTTGDGNDWIRTYGDSSVRAGNGNNFVGAGHRSSVITGDGADMITAGRESTVTSGAGDDVVKAGRRSTVVAGTGDDRITVDGETTIHFAAGDGNDIIGGGRRGHAYVETDRLSSSVLAFGVGISAVDLGFQPQGNDLVIGIRGSGDSVTLTDYQRHGIPTLTFADGTTLSSEEVAAAIGPSEEYRPVSQMMQRWFDAGTAYRATQAEGAGANSRSSVDA